MTFNRCRILGVPVDAVTTDQAVELVARWLDEAPAGRLITTPNPEMCVDSRKDPVFAAALSSAALAIPDGTGLIFASRRFGCRLPERVSGADLMIDICRLAAKKRRSVALIGDDSGSAESAARVLRRRFSSLKVAWAGSGGLLARQFDGTWRARKGVIEGIKAASPDVVFAAFGHGKQEIWLRSALPQLPSVRIGMGIGGTLDFVTGKAIRAPLAIRQAGFEWLWRLMREPHRAKRIFRAVVVFPWLVFFGKK